MLDQEELLEILARGGNPRKVSACDFCLHNGQPSCPPGHRVKGLCNDFVPDGKPVEERVIRVLKKKHAPDNRPMA